MMDRLPPELFGIILEQVCSLDDLGSLWLVNKQVAWMCDSIRPKTLWRIAYRTCWRKCEYHQEEEDCPGCSVVESALEDPASVPFKVRTWLYRRASRQSFGCSEEALQGCMVACWKDMDFNPYSRERGDRKLGIQMDAEGDSDEEDERGRNSVDREEGEWERVWLIFKRHLVMQRVQRVNVGDPTVPLEWKRHAPGSVEAEMALKRMEGWEIREIREMIAFMISLQYEHYAYGERRDVAG